MQQVGEDNLVAAADSEEDEAEPAEKELLELPHNPRHTPSLWNARYQSRLPSGGSVPAPIPFAASHDGQTGPGQPQANLVYPATAHHLAPNRQEPPTSSDVVMSRFAIADRSPGFAPSHRRLDPTEDNHVDDDNADQQVHVSSASVPSNQNSGSERGVSYSLLGSEGQGHTRTIHSGPSGNEIEMARPIADGWGVGGAPVAGGHVVVSEEDRRLQPPITAGHADQSASADHGPAGHGHYRVQLTHKSAQSIRKEEKDLDQGRRSDDRDDARRSFSHHGKWPRRRRSSSLHQRMESVLPPPRRSFLLRDASEEHRYDRPHRRDVGAASGLQRRSGSGATRRRYPTSQQLGSFQSDSSKQSSSSVTTRGHDDLLAADRPRAGDDTQRGGSDEHYSYVHGIGDQESAGGVSVEHDPGSEDQLWRDTEHGQSTVDHGSGLAASLGDSHAKDESPISAKILNVNSPNVNKQQSEHSRRGFPSRGGHLHHRASLAAGLSPSGHSSPSVDRDLSQLHSSSIITLSPTTVQPASHTGQLYSRLLLGRHTNPNQDDQQQQQPSPLELGYKPRQVQAARPFAWRPAKRTGRSKRAIEPSRDNNLEADVKESSVATSNTASALHSIDQQLDQRSAQLIQRSTDVDSSSIVRPDLGSDLQGQPEQRPPLLDSKELLQPDQSSDSEEPSNLSASRGGSSSTQGEAGADPSASQHDPESSVEQLNGNGSSSQKAVPAPATGPVQQRPKPMRVNPKLAGVQAPRSAQLASRSAQPAESRSGSSAGTALRLASVASTSTPAASTASLAVTTTSASDIDRIYQWQPTQEPLTRHQRLFYKNYDPTEGVTTAFVLGGFFVLVCLLVVYKTKLKPMWKERNKRLTNTPATRSEVNSSFTHLHKDFECIPLQRIPAYNQDESEEDDDIFFLDEYGNYIFPMSTSHAGICSCPHSTYDADTRRPSLISALSTAYTVKSLPGAMLYIPVDSEYNTPVALKRSLSDPEIYFPSPVKHSLIVAVNGLLSAAGRGAGAGGGGGGTASEYASNAGGGSSSSTAGGGGGGGGEGRGPMFGRSGSMKGGHYRMCQGAAGGGAGGRHHQGPPRLGRYSPAAGPSGGYQDGLAATKLAVTACQQDALQIDINVIQPTPNISPSASLRSMSAESRDEFSAASSIAMADESLSSAVSNSTSSYYSGIPFLVVPPSPARIRRVSFSEDEGAAAAATSAAHGCGDMGAAEDGGGGALDFASLRRSGGANSDDPDNDREDFEEEDEEADKLLRLAEEPDGSRLRSGSVGRKSTADGEKGSCASGSRRGCRRQSSLQIRGPDSPTSGRRRNKVTRQHTLPTSFNNNMTYLQVPGQERAQAARNRLWSPSERRRLPYGGMDATEEEDEISHNRSSSRRRKRGGCGGASAGYSDRPEDIEAGGGGRTGSSLSGGYCDDPSSGCSSPMLRRRRFVGGGSSFHQPSIESCYSFASEGDGDIFASAENIQNKAGAGGDAGARRGPFLARQASFCLPDSNISTYSEFNEDFHSSISELFGGHAHNNLSSMSGAGNNDYDNNSKGMHDGSSSWRRTSGGGSGRRGRLGTQGTFSEQGSIRSLSIDQEDVLYEGPDNGAVAAGEGVPHAVDSRGQDKGGTATTAQPQPATGDLSRHPDAVLRHDDEDKGEKTDSKTRTYINRDCLDYVEELPFDGDAAGPDLGGYMSSSSCSISISSDLESSHQITVPVFIEPAPPEIRLPPSGGINDDDLYHNNETRDTSTTGPTEEVRLPPAGDDFVGLDDVDNVGMSSLYLLGVGGAGGGMDHHGGQRSHRGGLVHQETMHTDSGLDTEDICPASPNSSIGRYSPQEDDRLMAAKDKSLQRRARPERPGSSDGLAGRDNSQVRRSSGDPDGGDVGGQHLRLVLVRDIGIQCSSESPSLSRRHPAAVQAQAASSVDEAALGRVTAAVDLVDEFERTPATRRTRSYSSEMLF